MRQIFYIICGAVVLFGSFFITLWLTEAPSTFAPQIVTDASSDAQRLAAERISNYSDLRSAAQSAGLRFSEDIKGSVDGIRRINDREEVNISGWLADLQGNSTPQNVLVFIRGSVVATARTSGERLDVAKALNFDTAAEQMKNVAFSLNFSCPSGEQPVVVGIGQRQKYIPLELKKPCP